MGDIFTKYGGSPIKGNVITGTGVRIPEDAFEVGTQSPIDGSKKYSFDNIYEDQNLINTAKSYYESLYDTKYRSDRDVVDEFIQDRTWKQANLVSVGSEFIDIQGLDAKQRENLAYLQDYWAQMPSFYEEGGRGWIGGIWANLWRGAVDPTNILSVGFGSLATKAATKKFGTTFLKKALNQKGLSKTAKKQLRNEIRDIENAIAKGTYTFPVKRATAVATGSAVAFDASLFAGADLINQKSEMDIGLRTKGDWDLKRTGQVAVIGGGISVLPSGFFAYSTVREISGGIKPSTVLKKTDSVLSDSKEKVLGKTEKEIKTAKDKKLSKKEREKKTITETTKKVLGETDKKASDATTKFVQRIFDNNNFYKRFGEILTGVKQTAKGIAGIYATQIKGAIDPILQSPYVFMRLLSSSLVRGQDFMKNGTMFFREVVDELGYKKVEYIASKNSQKKSPDGTIVGGLETIIGRFDKVGEGENFLMYMLARSVRNIHRRNKGKPKRKQQATPFDEKTAQRWIDYGEMTPNQYRNRYSPRDKKGKIIKGKEVESGRATASISFKEGSKQFKGATDDLLQYKLEGGMYSLEAIANIKKAYPDGWIPMWGRKDADKLNFFSTERLFLGIGSGGKKRAKMIGQLKGPVKLNPLYASVVDYVNFSVKAVDKNRAKVIFYKMLKDYGSKSNPTGKQVIDSSQIAIEKSKLKPGYSKAITKKTIQDLEQLNIKFEKNADGTIKGLDEADDTFTTVVFKDAFRDGDDVIDVVWIDGEAKYWKIESSLLKETFETLSTPTIWTKSFAIVRRISRLPAKAITYSPPFLAFNFVRDSMTATVNSAFGFIPLLSSIQGFGLTFTGNKNGSNMKKVVNAYRRNNGFRMAYVSGLGFTSRAETEWNPTVAVREIERYGNSSAVGWYKKNLNYLGYNFIRKGIKGYADFVGRLEYASRMAEYSYAKDHGLSSTAAAFLGREISTDFAMKGSSKALQNYAALTMFFNAGLQGFYRGARILKEQPKKAIPVLGAAIVAPEIILWNLNHKHREYNNVPDEVKMLNYLIPMYVKERKDGSHLHEDGTRKVEEFIAVPKPYDFGIFANIATAMLEAVRTKSPGVAFQYMATSFSIIMPGLAMPTLANPWVAMYTNLNWQGDKIKPSGFDKSEKKLQYKSNTRESVIQFTNFLYKITGNEGVALRGDGKMGVTFTPVMLDYMVNAYFTGLASYPIDILDAILWDNENFGDLPTQRGDRADLARQPWSIITRRFRVQVPIKNSKNIKIFYEIKNRADKVKNMTSLSERDLREVLNLEETYGVPEVQELLAISPFLSMVADKLKESREARKDIKKSKFLPGTEIDYTADLKAQHIKELIRAENEIARVAIIQLRTLNFDTLESDIFGTTYNQDLYKRKSTGGGTVSNQMFELFKK